MINGSSVEQPVMEVEQAHDDPMSLDDDSDTATEVLCCAFCYDAIGDDVIKPCNICKSQCCSQCIRRMFLAACKSESDMPPRCCKAIPLAVGRRVLSLDEIGLFKAKHEEWSTANRSYCPIPTCSTFLPRRLFPDSTVSQPGGMEMDIDEPFSTSYVVFCPQCAVQICPTCKQLIHPGFPCADIPDISPELADLLKRWGVKRCPKCRAAVRRMYGCRHMQCRCGAQWCWFCTEPIDTCETYPCFGWEEERAAEGDSEENSEDDADDDNDNDDDDDDDDDDEQDEENEKADEKGEGTGLPDQVRETQDEAKPVPIHPDGLVDLDAGTHWENGPEDFGQEPNETTVDQFHCTHDFEEAEDSEIDPTLEYECERCWCRVVPKCPSDPTSAHPIQFPNNIPNARLRLCSICNIILCPTCCKDLGFDDV